MKLDDLQQVNRLVSDLEDVKALIGMAERAETEAFQVFIEAPGDASVKLSAQGTTTAHARGVATSVEFLNEVKKLTVKELRSRERALLAELRGLGVEAGA